MVSKHGLAADELISGLQKSIRRSNAENALAISYEMYLTSESLEDYLWKRLLIISVEDIGLAAPKAHLQIRNPEQIRLKFHYA